VNEELRKRTRREAQEITFTTDKKERAGEILENGTRLYTSRLAEQGSTVKKTCEKQGQRRGGNGGKKGPSDFRITEDQTIRHHCAMSTKRENLRGEKSS